MVKKPRIGVALYAQGNPYGREGNVACAKGGQPFEFATASDLPGQTLWVTNCSLSALIDAGLHKNPKIAHDGYYRTRLAQMIQELGADTLAIDQQAALLAECLGNAAEMSRVQLGLSQYPTRGVAQAVGQLFGAQEPPRGSALYQVAEQSCQRYTSCERERRLEKADIFTFWFPRYEWANKLLETPVPTNHDLKIVPPHALPELGRDIGAMVEWAEDNKLPIFTRVRIHGLEENVGRLLNYGAGAPTVQRYTSNGDYEARNLREWCALPELDFLSLSGELEVLQVAVAGGWVNNGVHVYSSRLGPVSYAYGLVAENLWAGITRRPDPSGNVSRSLSTAWLQAVDRMDCIKVAECLQRIGMDVLSYGNGRITVACPASVRALIPQVAREHGLMYPAALKDLEHYRARPDKPAEVMQHLLNSRNYSRIIQVDQAMLKELETSRAT